VARQNRRRVSQRLPALALHEILGSLPTSAGPACIRLRLPDGSLTDMTNLTRARDAIANHEARS
jgi:hypothetical protein